MDFTGQLLAWYDANRRDLPWKQTADPYKIWLSEIILQQTRVEQGAPYYMRFAERFPTVEALAAAHIDEVLRLWQGLGYYSRARHLHLTAQQIVEQRRGIFPSSYRELLTLKGIGPYTAAAIASFAWNEPIPAIDG
ncbi:MAG: A/G-specific adenine glycosylase, partial [Prevotellaceae bacterium]|nr:A/G-specific adenine glycosylase [Prevotellaceae bacterium]